jgi:predicted ATP-grasp superfamily ATP-dependent carboligase
VTKFRKVLLLDGYSTRTLACVRSWGARNVRFAVGGISRWDMSLFSRYCRERFVYTSPGRDLTHFVADVNRYAEEFDADCVLPTSEAAIMACSKCRSELKPTAIIPDESQIQLMFSKARTLRLAEKLGIRAPKTIHVTRADSADLKELRMDFPVVLKSENSEVMGTAKSVRTGGTAYVSTPTEMLQECSSRLHNGNGVLLQEFVEGDGVGVSGIFAEGRPVALLGHRRIRESTPTGGPSALAETISIEPELLDSAKALIREIGLTGPAMVEFKIERKSKRPYLMEINGRFWGSVLLASAAGLDLPYLYWKVLNGWDISPDETSYRVGVRGRYIVGDTKWLFLCLKGKPSGWPGEYPKRWETLKSYVREFFEGRTKELILTGDDPKPFFARLIQDW